MQFLELATTFEKLEKTRSTLAMREILSLFLKKTPAGEIGIAVNLLEGQLATPYEGIVLGVAEKMALRAIADAFEVDEKTVHSRMKKLGDAGLCAQSFSSARKARITIKEVHSTLLAMSASSGAGSQDTKTTLLASLLKRSTPLEARYLTRIVIGQLRLGCGTMTLLDSFAIAYLGGKESRPALEHAYNICPDIAIIAMTARKNGINGIRKIGITVGRPIKVMLASRVKEISTITEKMPVVLAEEKYDGERVQAHFDGKRIVLFSRRMDTITDQFPDVVKALDKSVKATSYVLEGEVCAVDLDGKLEPFQKLMQRRRKHDVEAYASKVPVTLFLFDLLYLNGKTMLDKPLLERRKLLARIVTKGPILTLARNIVTTDIDEVEDFFTESLNRGCEGIIAKNATDLGVYQPGTRGWLWIKWKPEYSTDLQDTFDLVVVGGYRGKGKRSGSFGALLCAAYNKPLDRYETLCKVGSGFKDQELAKLEKRLTRHKSIVQPRNVIANKAQQPDVWFKPVEVMEVLGAELTRSPTHPCAERNGKGLALRFPRFVRWRDDKDAEQATTSSEIEKMVKGR